MKNKIIVFVAAVIALCVFSSCSNPEDEDELYGTGDGIKFKASPDMDTYLDYPLVTTNYGYCTNLRIGSGPYGAKYRAIMHFNLRDIPIGKSIEYAAITFSCVKVSGTAKITAYPVTTFWQEGASPCAGYTTFNAGWRYANDSGPGGRAWVAVDGGGDYLITPMSDTVDIKSAGTYTFMLNKAIVKAWTDDWLGNLGLIIIAGGEATWDNSILLGSKESSAAAVLRIRYK